MPSTPVSDVKTARIECAEFIPEIETVVCMRHNMPPFGISPAWLPLRDGWIFPAGHERLLERGHERVVSRSRLPEHPTVKARIVNRTLLFLDLMRAVSRRPKSECLDPRAHALALQSDFLVALAGTRNRDVHDVIRLRMRALDSERAMGIVRRICHRKHDVDRFGQRLPELSHLERPADGRHKAEHVRRRANSEFIDALLRRGKEISERLRLPAVVRLGEDLWGKALVRLRESDVIELNFPEAHACRFFCDAKVVLPDRARVRVHPHQSLLVAPRRAVRPSYCMRRIPLRSHRILEDDDPRDRQYPVRPDRIHHRLKTRDLHLLALVSPKQRVGRVEVQPELVLHVDYECVDLGGSRDRDEIVHPLPALRREAVEIESTHGHESANRWR